MKYGLTPEEFIQFLLKRCNEAQVKGSHLLSVDEGRNEAYGEIKTLINLYIGKERAAA